MIMEEHLPLLAYPAVERHGLVDDSRTAAQAVTGESAALAYVDWGYTGDATAAEAEASGWRSSSSPFGSP